MANFGAEVIYHLRDLGYYGEFCERDITRICQSQPKMRHLFTFLKEEVTVRDNVLDQASLNEERRCVELTQGMQANQVAEKAREVSIETVLGLPDVKGQMDTEIQVLEQECQLLERQLQVRERQENILLQE